MMYDTMVTLVGNAATAVEHRQTTTGASVVRFRLATSSRRWDKERCCWVDGDPSFYTIRAWRTLADHVAASVSRGEPLVVHGRMRVWERELPEDKGGQRRVSVEVDAVAVGHDLSRGTSAFRRVTRPRTEPAPPPTEPAAPGSRTPSPPGTAPQAPPDRAPAEPDWAAPAPAPAPASALDSASTPAAVSAAGAEPEATAGAAASATDGAAACTATPATAGAAPEATSGASPGIVGDPPPHTPPEAGDKSPPGVDDRCDPAAIAVPEHPVAVA
ncbi:single-stranded DNA-binding protein [Streptomyces sp. NPDC018019]|uniref:single-stranded DNA-binding protein n=1 Tax=Streptomyces sp. NPDC018019 TaxID=3365030 RepID=UPI0037BB89B2